MRWLVSVLVALLFGCQTSEYPAPIPGTAYRIGKDTFRKDSEVYIDLLTTWRECMGAGVADLEACLPRADRAAGEVQLGFVLRDPQTSTQLFRSLTEDQIRVTHNGSTQTDIQLIPHEPVEGGQLFILLIDGSGSMHENNQERIRKVYDALLQDSVVERFFPNGASTKSGVVLLRFSDKVVGIDGGPPRVITKPGEYKDLIKGHLMERSGGYTHLYGAVRYGVTELLNEKRIADYITVKGAEPTFVVLTDGFNNEEAKDSCGDNVPRLQETVDLLRERRTLGTANIRPVLFAVGLGTPIDGGRMPKSKNAKVTASSLCGPFRDRRIDGDLEDYGIDAVSLQWMARAGGGRSFVRRNADELAEVFKEAARPRYRWYELRYRTSDALYHRKSFDIEVLLTSAEIAQTTVSMFPSAWVDAPSGRREVDGSEEWVYPTAFRESLLLLLMPLGLLVFLFFLSPALFTARRALTRRARPRR